MMYLLSAIFVLAASIFITASLKFSSKLSYLLSIYLFSFTNITLTGHIGHAFSTLNSQFFYIAVEVLLLVLAIFTWFRQNKPNLNGPFKNIKSDLAQIKFLANPDIFVLLLGVVIAMSIAAYLWIQVPPNNNDSLSTHMVRVLYWLQHGNYQPWETQRTWQIIYPVNAQLNMMWTVLMTGSDHWVGLIQWSAALFSALAVMGIARELKATRQGALFAGLIFLTYPIVALQSTTTQNSLVASALFGIGFYFFYRFLTQNTSKLLVLSGLALGIAIGTKQTVLFLLPGWGVAILILWLVYKKVTFQKLLLWAAVIIGSFLILGSQIFFINLKNYGNPLGPNKAVQSSTTATASLENAVTQVSLNSTRFLYQLADPSGLPSPFWRWGIKFRSRVATPIFENLNIPIESQIATARPHQFSLDEPTMLQEDEAWFGLLGFIVIVPSLAILTIINIQQKNVISMSIFLTTVGFFICDTLLRPGWDPYQGRYFIPVAVLCTGLFSLWMNRKIFRWIIGPLFTLIGLSVIFNVMLFNPGKALITERVPFYYHYPQDPGYEEIGSFEPVLKLTRLEKLTTQTRSSRTTCQFIDDFVPADATLAYASAISYFQEYCYFGETLERTVIPLHPLTMLEDEQFLLEANIDYMFFYRFKENDLPQFSHFTLVATNSDQNLYLYQKNN